MRISAFLLLRAAKQDFAFAVAGNGAAQVCQHLHTALNRRSGANQVKPFFKMREVGPVYALVFPAAQPRENGNVGDGVLVSGDEFATAQLPVITP